jgi:YVTN family beta-propeller protein
MTQPTLHIDTVFKGFKKGLVELLRGYQDESTRYQDTSIKSSPKLERKWYGEPGTVEPGEGEDHFIDTANEALKAILTPANKRDAALYKKDLKRFGTAQGIIDVSNDEKAKKQREHLGERMQRSGAALKKVFDKAEREQFQLRIQNHLSNDQEVLLWGANRYGIHNSQDVPGHLVSLASITTGLQPQGVVYNPVNGYTYVANQLSGTVSVIGANHELVTDIVLNPVFPGFNSPVALAVNTNVGSLHYGWVYVAGSVADTLTIINTRLEIDSEIQAGKRPVAVVFNPANDQLYIACLVDRTIMVIDAETHTQVNGSPLAAGEDPLALVVNPVNGDVYVANSTASTLTVFNRDHSGVTTIHNVGNRPCSLVFSPVANLIYAVAEGSNQVFAIDPVHYTIQATIQVGSQPYGIFYDGDHQVLCVENKGDGTLSIIDQNSQVIDTLPAGWHGTGGVWNTAEHDLYVSDATTGQVHIMQYVPKTELGIEGDYTELCEDFRSSPARIDRVRFMLDGPEHIKGFRQESYTARGQLHSRSLSFENYISPQSRLNVSEIYDLSGARLDGNMSWRFTLPGQHTATILVSYRQLPATRTLYQRHDDENNSTPGRRHVPGQATVWGQRAKTGRRAAGPRKSKAQDFHTGEPARHERQRHGRTDQ